MQHSRYSLLIAYKRAFDKDNFIKRSVVDNLLLVDIYNRAKKLHIEYRGARRVIFIVRRTMRRLIVVWTTFAES